MSNFGWFVGSIINLRILSIYIVKWIIINLILVSFLRIKFVQSRSWFPIVQLLIWSEAPQILLPAPKFILDFLNHIGIKLSIGKRNFDSGIILIIMNLGPFLLCQTAFNSRGHPFIIVDLQILDVEDGRLFQIFHVDHWWLVRINLALSLEFKVGVSYLTGSSRASLRIIGLTYFFKLPCIIFQRFGLLKLR